jgi:hypothetical protein
MAASRSGLVVGEAVARDLAVAAEASAGAEGEHLGRSHLMLALAQMTVVGGADSC